MDILWRILAEIGGFLRGGRPERRCRSGEEIGDVCPRACGCSVNSQGYGTAPRP